VNYERHLWKIWGGGQFVLAFPTPNYRGLVPLSPGIYARW